MTFSRKKEPKLYREISSCSTTISFFFFFLQRTRKAVPFVLFDVLSKYTMAAVLYLLSSFISFFNCPIHKRAGSKKKRSTSRNKCYGGTEDAEIQSDSGLYSKGGQLDKDGAQYFFDAATLRSSIVFGSWFHAKWKLTEEEQRYIYRPFIPVDVVSDRPRGRTQLRYSQTLPASH